MTIDIGVRLTSSNFDEFIQTNWQKTLSASIITFNFKETEWVAVVEMTFLLSWIYKLKDSKTIEIELPTVSTSTSKESEDNKKTWLNIMTYDWKITAFEKIGIRILRGNLTPNRKNINEDLPFCPIETINYNLESFDNDFDNIHNNQLKIFTDYVHKKLKTNTELTYFDNHFLHYSILKELYSNVCLHAYPESEKNKNCYISLKIDSKKSIYIQEKNSERPKEEQEYFSKHQEDNNLPYIEFSFLDFGEGIVAKMKEKYERELIKNPEIIEYLGKKHLEKNIETRILEYAFLLFTSRYELEEDNLIHDYVPRGLFVIKNIVKRYGGLIITRSNLGKVVFDYSNVNSKSDVDCVVYRENDLSHEVSFPGTIITIILPSKTNKKSNIKYTTKREKGNPPPLKFIQLIDIHAKTNNELFRQKILNVLEKRKKYYEFFFRELFNSTLAL